MQAFGHCVRVVYCWSLEHRFPVSRAHRRGAHLQLRRLKTRAHHPFLVHRLDHVHAPNPVHVPHAHVHCPKHDLLHAHAHDHRLRRYLLYRLPLLPHARCLMYLRPHQMHPLSYILVVHTFVLSASKFACAASRATGWKCLRWRRRCFGFVQFLHVLSFKVSLTMANKQTTFPGYPLLSHSPERLPMGTSPSPRLLI